MDFSDADLDNSPSKPISKNSSTTSVPLKSSIKVRIFLWSFNPRQGGVVKEFWNVANTPVRTYVLLNYVLCAFTKGGI